MRVVVAEDLFLLRDGLTRLLTAHDFEIAAAVDNAPGLLSALLEERPDVAVVDVRLPPGEPADRLVAGPPAEQLGHHLGIHDGAASGHGADRVDELVVVEHPVLEQVADRARLVSEQLTRVQLLDVLGQQDHREAGYLPPCRQGGLQPVIGERRRQPDVHDRDVRPLLKQGAQ